MKRRYVHDDHDYDIRVPDDEIRRLLVELERPHRSEKVLRYLHFELEMGSQEIGAVFGVTRQTIQKIVRNFSWEFHRKRGDSYAVDGGQATLGDYDTLTMADLVDMDTE